jgi:hypothetical protein
MSLLKWALIMLVVSLVAALFGFTDLAAASAEVARELREGPKNTAARGRCERQQAARAGARRPPSSIAIFVLSHRLGHRTSVAVQNSATFSPRLRNPDF